MNELSNTDFIQNLVLIALSLYAIGDLIFEKMFEE
jgi:hypothetical protein